LAFADRFVDPLWGLTSPVFFSRDDGGKIVRGLQSVPTGVQGRPVLLVGNHQLLGDTPAVNTFLEVEKKMKYYQ